jgi:hypothetical protein
MDVVLTVFLMLGGLLLYLLPTIVSARRNHPHMIAIAVLNILAGWTFAGWMVAMVWSCIDLSPTRRESPTEVASPERSADLA